MNPQNTQTNATHTPSLSFDGTYIHDDNGKRFLAVSADESDLGHIFAAAPELLAALEQIEDEINRTGSPSCDGWDKARAAIAKARGQS